MTPITPLVAAARRDPAAYAAIVARFQDAAFASAYARLGCAQQAREVTQEALLEGWVRLETLRVDEAFTTWFRRIVFKQIDRVTRRRSLPLVPLHAVAPPGVWSGDGAEAAELRDRITDGLARLSDPLRTTFTLFYLAGWPITEIADWLQVPPGTVKKRLHTARQRLQADMEDVMADYLTHARPSTDGRMARQVQLYIAARSGDLEAVEALLEADPGLVNAPEDVDLTDPAVYLLLGGSRAQRPLHLAASFGHAEVAAALVRRGAAVNATSKSGQTPLHTAAMLGHAPVVSALLAGGADRNAAHRGGLTALHIAAIRGDDDVAALLLDAGADPTLTGRGGRTPAHWAGLRGHFALAARLAQAEARRIARRQRGFLHTGIKAIDLLAPIPRGGRVHLVGGPYGVGMMVLMGELLYRLRGLRPVMLAVGDRFTDAEDFRVFLREAGLADAVTLLTTQPDDTPADLDALAAEAIAAAGDGLLLVDRALDDHLGQTAATTVLFEYYGEHEAMNPVRPEVEATITLSHALARRGLYPAIDESQSSSTAPVTPDHRRLAAAVRAALADSERLRGYLTQPFISVETFNGFPGQTVQIEDTLADCAALLDGAYDDVPAERLRYLGRASEGRIQGV